jgi:hypothetical protein
VEALRNPTKPYERWVSFLNPTYDFSFFVSLTEQYCPQPPFSRGSKTS